MIAMSLHESFACPDETEAPGISMIQVDELKQGVRPFDRTGIQFSDLSLEVGGFFEKPDQFSLLDRTGEKPKRWKG